jgi:4,5-dihydroxyphthalate decarboxylase
MSVPPVLRAAFGDYPHTRALRTGALRDDAVAFDLVPIEPIHAAFAPMVRDLAFDLSELAIVTALQALAYERPIILLPLVLSARFQRQCLVGYRPRGLIDPAALRGQSVGVRAFTQTTGMWVRAALLEDYGVPTSAIRWRTRDPAHVAEFIDPPFVEHDVTGKDLAQQLRDGDLVGAIMGADMPDDPDFVPLIRDHQAADRRSYDRRGFMPVNHMVAVTADAAARAPDAIRAAYRLFTRAIDAAPSAPDKPAVAAYGFGKLSSRVGYAIEEAVRQHLLPREIDIEQVWAPARQLLGDIA